MKNKMNCGYLLAEGLIAAAVLGIIAVTIFYAFGSGRDSGDISSDYVVATALAQRQLAILENRAGWVKDVPQAQCYIMFEPVNDTLAKYSSYNRIVTDEADALLTFDNISKEVADEGTIFYCQISCEPVENNVFVCNARVWWAAESVTGTHTDGGAAKEYSVTLTRLFPK